MILANYKITEDSTRCSRGWMYKQLSLVVENASKVVEREVFKNGQGRKQKVVSVC
ncbi:hypothetical protein [Clostridium sp.]|uniref:hypothetical protein n=1 Tax=Clostridium sp. TaxID=1506 RepID=UPI002FC85ACA